MAKVKFRKIKPAVPHHFWYDVDGCWFCKNRNACGNCKVAKRYLKEHTKDRRKKNDLYE